LVSGVQFEPPPSRTNFHQNKGAIPSSTLKEELLPTYHGECQASTLKDEYSPSEIVSSTLKDEFPPPFLSQKTIQPLPFSEEGSNTWKKVLGIIFRLGRKRIVDWRFEGCSKSFTFTYL
jgi:hypothetical protein